MLRTKITILKFLSVFRIASLENGCTDRLPSITIYNMRQNSTHLDYKLYGIPISFFKKVAKRGQKVIKKSLQNIDSTNIFTLNARESGIIFISTEW